MLSLNVRVAQDIAVIDKVYATFPHTWCMHGVKPLETTRARFHSTKYYAAPVIHSNNPHVTYVLYMDYYISKNLVQFTQSVWPQQLC